MRRCSSGPRHLSCTRKNKYEIITIYIANVVTTERERGRERRREGEKERGRASPYLVVIIVIKLLVDTLQNPPPTLPPSLGLGYLELKDAIATPLRWDGDPL